MTPLINLVIADRYPIVLDALDTLFRDADGFSVVARCLNAPDVRSAVATHQPDVLVSDVWINERDPLAFVPSMFAYSWLDSERHRQRVYVVLGFVFGLDAGIIALLAFGVCDILNHVGWH